MTRLPAWLALLLLAAPAVAQPPALKGQPGRRGAFAQPTRPVAPPAPQASLLKREAWQEASTTTVRPGEIDGLVAAELAKAGIKPAPLTTDEQFLRRVTLDLTGQLPVPADVAEFLADSDPNKRAKLIDRLLDSEEYARHWATYWRDVIAAKITDRRGLALARPFEEWLTKQFRQNRGWDRIARDLITAEGSCRFDDDGEHGPLFFLASRTGADAAVEQAAETSRVFLGIQIQCAQCHDHPSDQWKRVQFHELTAYFTRVRGRPMRDGQRLVGIELFQARAGEHSMPALDDPKKSFTVHPRFLDGKSPGANRADADRRAALADAITDKTNYWFAGAFVNRIWGELMGQSFYQPVDDMGPQKEAIFPAVLTRLSGAFRGSDYDVKALLRAVCNTETYQRQIRLGESADYHLHFAASYPTRLRADALWESLVNVLGNPGGPPRPRPVGPFAGRAGLEGQFKDEFDFDPSLKADEVEGSIAQALLMMNNPQINQRLQARGTNLLGRVLSHYKTDDEALRIVYLRVLARKPTDRELTRCREHLRTAGSRAAAFEDVLWALLNSTEFQSRR
jgi:hypothetical protein